MKKLFTLLLQCSCLLLFAQKDQLKPDHFAPHSHHGTVCEMGEPMPGFVIPAPAKKRNNPKEPAVFEVIYGSNVTQAEKDAFERAANILGDLFSSPMPISVTVNGVDTLPSNTLAGASPGGYLRNFRNAPLLDAWYPIALAEKIARTNFNTVTSPYDINVTFNSEANWNYTSTGVGANEFDFTTVILHELLHGLGFSAAPNLSQNSGSLLLSGFQLAYSKFIENRAGQNLVASFDDPSLALGTQLRSNNLFMKSPSFANATELPKIYAPSVFTTGSSISHLDNFTYLGTPNGLMSPSINMGAIVHDPGPIALDILYDLGWSFTSIIHEPGTGTDDVSQAYTVNASVFSDNGYDASSMVIHYSQDSFKTETVLAMTPTGQENEFTATLPAPNEVTKYQYYFSLNDLRQIQILSPSEAPDPLFYEFFYAIDETLPEIVHEPITTLDDQTSELIIEASVTDFFTGVNEVLIDFKINGTNQDQVPMQRDLTDGFRPDLYIGAIPLPTEGLAEGDNLEYRIIANDKSPKKNTINSPGNDFYQVSITKTLDAITQYVNEFEIDEQDFTGNGFSIAKPSGFPDQAIHSLHPYTNAGENNTRNFSYSLRLPIVIRRSNALIEFDEIVLVEPGEPGTNFGDTEFWDYVIVEGRRTNGTIWRPFLDGYDSNAQSSWKSLYNSNIQQQNSQAVGSDRLYKERVIDMHENGNFAEGDTVLVRFRLFSDPFAVGWGWAIDNLRIQDAPVAVTDFIEHQNFKVYPNPVGDQLLNISAHFKQPVENMEIQLHDIYGRLLFQKSIKSPTQQFSQQLNTQGFAKGIYLVTLVLDKQDQISKRVVVR